MDRRAFLVLWLQALLLSLFPWLRTERGIEVAERVAEAWVPQGTVFPGGIFKLTMRLKGWEMPGKWKQWLSEHPELVVPR